MTWRIGGVCPDAVLYIQLAQALEAGDLRASLREMRINTFPAILMLLHRAGLEWELAGQAWNVLVASLVVLPLFGWVRRQFDDRIALVSCLLIAIHPKFIEWSPEIIRDPTFWFLFTLSIYLLWRAITEVRLVLFLTAGAVGTLAALTRFEGLFLMIPLVAWTFWRLLALRRSRGRLLLGAVLCVVAFPVLLAVVNLIYFRGQHFELSRLRPLEAVHAWLQTHLGPGGSESGTTGLSFRQMVWDFFPIMTRGLSPAFALLMFGGIWGWRHVWSRRDHQALFYTALAVVGGIWMGLWFLGISCPRYALSVVLLAVPFAALGLLGFTARCLRAANWVERTAFSTRLAPRLTRFAIAFPWVIVVAVTMAVVFSTNYDLRWAEIGLGHWVREQIGPRAVVLGPEGSTTAVTYYGGLDCRLYGANADQDAICAMVAAQRPDVLLLGPRRMDPRRSAQIVQRVEPLGLRPVDPDALPRGSERFRVLSRESCNHPSRSPDARPSCSPSAAACRPLGTELLQR